MVAFALLRYIQTAAQKPQADPQAGVGETLQPVIPGFNESLGVERRADRLGSLVR